MRRSANVFLLSILSLSLLAGCSGGTSGILSPRSSTIESQLLAEIALDRGEYLVAIQELLKVAQRSRDPQYAEAATELAWEFGYDAYALAAAERWVKLDRENRIAKAYLGRLYVRRNSLDKAWTTLEAALGQVEERTEQDYAILAGDVGGEYVARGQLLFERFNASYPDHGGITRSLAELAAQSGDLEVAIAAARETVALRPDWYATRVWLARLLLANGERSSAFEQMAFALEMNPGLELDLEFVQLLAMAGEGKASLERLERLSERYSDSVVMQMMKANIYTLSGETALAEQVYVDLLTTGTCLNECLWQLGGLAYQRGDYYEAIGYFERVSSGNRLPQSRMAASQAYLQLDDTESALQILRNFAADYPRDAFDMLQPQAIILAQVKRWDDALAVNQRAIDYRPWSERLWLYRGGLLEEAGQTDKALEAFRSAWELAPDSATTMNALGYTLTITTRKYREAESYISKALELEPDNPAIMDSMGWVLFKRGKPEEALEWLEQAYLVMPDPEVAAHLGEVLWVSGDREEAEGIWLEALQMFPDNAVLLETVKRFSK